MIKFVKSFYLHNNLFLILWGIVILFVLSFFFYWLFNFSIILLYVLVSAFLFDIIVLYSKKNNLVINRILPNRFSNCDINEVNIELISYYSFKINVSVYDEIPFQFQQRKNLIKETLLPFEKKIISYSVVPKERGKYNFGKCNVLISSKLKLIEKKVIGSENVTIPTYPSFVQMKKYEMLAFTSHSNEFGIKKVRRIGDAKEFDHIKEYVNGDDYRKINWRASARRNNLMTNHYQDERSQNIYSLIDMGRTMRMPFNEMTLLDYSINSTLAILNIVLKKYENAGLITFSDKIETIIKADKKSNQLHKIIESLYNQKTNFSESNYELLTSFVLRNIKQKSLLLLFSNIETLSSMRRNLIYFRELKQRHLLTIIFFENTELNKILNIKPKNVEEIYLKTITEKFSFEKRLIINELNRDGIHTILTKPENLSVNTINKYLELKARGLI